MTETESMAHYNIGLVGGRWMLLVFLAGCPPFDPDGPYRCESEADCRLDEHCSEHICVPACAPKSCAELPGRCGLLLDNCGGTIECECAPPETCGGGGLAGLCGCTPITCEDGCGTFDDGCGATIECGCDAPGTCGGGGISGRCGCVPRSCDERGAECGLAPDGCSETLYCGGCSWPDHCGGETINRCGRPPACVAQGAACGFLGLDYCGTCTGGELCGVPSANQCGRPATCLAEGRACGFSAGAPGVFCGGCAKGELCEAGDCVPAIRPFCWSEPELMDLSERGWRVHAAADAGQLALFGTHTVPNDAGCSRIGRIALLDYAALATATYALLDSSDFSDLSLSGCVENTLVSCEGWVGTPRVRSDGLEMFFDSSYRCGDWWDREVYVSHRRNPSEPWSPPALVPVSAYQALPDDQVHYPLLLPDQQTLLYRDDALPKNELSVARRSSSTPGDARFQKMGSVAMNESTSDNELFGLVPEAVSCDGRFLLYYREVNGVSPGEGARAAEILSLDPLQFGDPMPYPGVEGAFAFSESPDCGALYLATRSDQFVRRRLPCP